MPEDAAETWLTIAGLAARLGRSESGVRDWRKAGRGLIPERIGADGVRRYPLSVFERIAVLRRRDVSLANIRDALATADPEPPPARDDALLAVLERIARAVERIADRLEGEDAAPPS